MGDGTVRVEYLRRVISYFAFNTSTLVMAPLLSPWSYFSKLLGRGDGGPARVGRHIVRNAPAEAVWRA